MKRVLEMLSLIGCSTNWPGYHARQTSDLQHKSTFFKEFLLEYVFFLCCAETWIISYKSPRQSFPTKSSTSLLRTGSKQLL